MAALLFLLLKPPGLGMCLTFSVCRSSSGVPAACTGIVPPGSCPRARASPDCCCCKKMCCSGRFPRCFRLFCTGRSQSPGGTRCWLHSFPAPGRMQRALMQDALEMCLKMLSRSLGAGLLLGSLNLSPPFASAALGADPMLLQVCFSAPCGMLPVA